METELVIETCEFWFVWTKDGRVPRYVHSTQESAETEADRLARAIPGKKFIVLRGYRKVHAIRSVVVPEQCESGKATTPAQAGYQEVEL